MPEVAQPELARYRSHKIVHAAKIMLVSNPDESAGFEIRVALEGGAWRSIDQAWIRKHCPAGGTIVGGYFVEYEDGYTSWSPAKAFEEGYVRLMKRKGLNPVNKVTFVKPDKPLEKIGEIFVVTSQETAPASHGIVLATDSALCKVGDRVVYSRFWPTDVNGEDLVVVDEKNLVGVDTDPAPQAEGTKSSVQVDPPKGSPIVAPSKRQIVH